MGLEFVDCGPMALALYIPTSASYCEVRLLGQALSELPPGLKIHYPFGSLLWGHLLPLTEMWKKITIGQLYAVLCVRYLT